MTTTYFACGRLKLSPLKQEDVRTNYVQQRFDLASPLDVVTDTGLAKIALDTVTDELDSPYP